MGHFLHVILSRRMIRLYQSGACTVDPHNHTLGPEQQPVHPFLNHRTKISRKSCVFLIFILPYIQLDHRATLVWSYDLIP